MVNEEVMTCWRCGFRILRGNLMKTKGICPKCKVTVLVKEFSTFGIDPKLIKQGEKYLDAVKRIVGEVT